MAMLEMCDIAVEIEALKYVKGVLAAVAIVFVAVCGRKAKTFLASL